MAKIDKIKVDNIEYDIGADYSNIDNKPNLSTVATSGSYNDLSDKPTIPDVSDFITKDVNDLTYYTLATETGSTIELSINSSTYVMTMNLKNSAGTTISTQNVDLPLESVVVSGSYDSVNKKIVLTLQSGSTIDIPVGDLISGLQSEITSSNKLSSDLVDDTISTNKFVTSAEKSAWNNKSDFSGDYNDLTNKPTIPVVPTNVSAFTNDAGYLTQHQDISGKQDIIQYATMPTASADNVGKIVQYIGNTTATFTQGHFYIVEVVGGSTLSYEWQELNVENLENYATKYYVDTTKQSKVQYSTMPTAGSTTVGKIVQYIGVTDSNYTNGYFYIGTTDGESTPTYSWENINVQDSSGGGGAEPLFEITVDNMRQSQIYTDIITYYYTYNKKPRVVFSYNMSFFGDVKWETVNFYFEIYNGTNNILYLDFGDFYYDSISKKMRWTLYCSIQVAFNKTTYVAETPTIKSWRYGNSTEQVLAPMYRFGSTSTGALMVDNIEAFTPTSDYHPSTKLYTDKTHYENMAGYDATKTQVLKNINGTLTWVDES